MSDIKDLINAIESGKSDEINTHFNAVMANKVGERLDAMRQDLAQNMFKTAVSEDSAEVAGETEEVGVEEEQ